MFSYGKNKKSLTSGWASHLKVNYIACMLSNQSYMMYLANRPSVLQASFYCSTIECPLFCSLYPRQSPNSVFLIATVIGNLYMSQMKHKGLLSEGKCRCNDSNAGDYCCKEQLLWYEIWLMGHSGYTFLKFIKLPWWWRSWLEYDRRHRSYSHLFSSARLPFENFHQLTFSLEALTYFQP